MPPQPRRLHLIAGKLPSNTPRITRSTCPTAPQERRFISLCRMVIGWLKSGSEPTPASSGELADE